MNKVLVLSKGTGQSKAFERFVNDYTEKYSLNIEWIFSTDSGMWEIIENGDINVALISPEMLLVEKKIQQELEGANIPYSSIKPADFGLKRIEKILPTIEEYLK